MDKDKLLITMFFYQKLKDNEYIKKDELYQLIQDMQKKELVDFGKVNKENFEKAIEELGRLGGVKHGELEDLVGTTVKGEIYLLKEIDVIEKKKRRWVAPC